jgi:predicted transcriptional regulator
VRRSKLELYVDIINVLSQKGPLKLTHLMHKTNTNCGVLSVYLDSLLEKGLIEKRIIEQERIVFAVTQRGKTVMNYFRELTQILPIIENKKQTAYLRH